MTWEQHKAVMLFGDDFVEHNNECWLRLSTPQVGYIWYKSFDQGWAEVHDCEKLETKFRAELERLRVAQSG